eukprot:3193196-Rhodomonas_salina.1
MHTPSHTMSIRRALSLLTHTRASHRVPILPADPRSSVWPQVFVASDNHVAYAGLRALLPAPVKLYWNHEVERSFLAVRLTLSVEMMVMGMR